MKEVRMGRRSMVGDTEPGMWSRVKTGASGNSSQKTSRHRSPPRIPVSQSWTSATFMVTRRPAASAGRRHRPLAPVREKIFERSLEGNLHFPAHGLPDLRRVSLQYHDVRGPQPRRIALDGDSFDPGLLQEEIEHLLDRPGATRTEVVDLTRLPPLQQPPVAAHDVADVGEISPRLQIPDEDDRLAEAGLDLGHLLGEVRGDEDLAATRSLVVEGARADDGQAIAHEVLVAHHVLGHLAHRVR